MAKTDLDKIVEKWYSISLPYWEYDDYDFEKIVSNPELFMEAYKRLSETEQDILEESLIKFVNVFSENEHNNIKLEVEGVRKANKKEIEGTSYKFLIRFKDNLRGNTLLFIPTYGWVDPTCYYRVYNKSGVKLESDRKDNLIVKDWGFESSIGDMGWEGDGSDSYSWLSLFSPPSYIDMKKNRINMYIQGENSLGENITTFKKILTEKFIPDEYSPIAYRIRKLINKGYGIFEKERLKKEEKEKMLKDKGKITLKYKGKKF